MRRREAWQLSSSKGSVQPIWGRQPKSPIAETIIITATMTNTSAAHIRPRPASHTHNAVTAVRADPNRMTSRVTWVLRTPELHPSEGPHSEPLKQLHIVRQGDVLHILLRQYSGRLVLRQLSPRNGNCMVLSLLPCIVRTRCDVSRTGSTDRCTVLKSLRWGATCRTLRRSLASFYGPNRSARPSWRKRGSGSLRTLSTQKTSPHRKAHYLKRAAEEIELAEQLCKEMMERAKRIKGKSAELTLKKLLGE